MEIKFILYNVNNYKRVKSTTVELTKAAAEEKRRLLSEAAVVIVAAAAAVAPEPLRLPKFGRDRDPHKVRVKKRVSKTTNLSATSKNNKAFSSSNKIKI